MLDRTRSLRLVLVAVSGLAAGLFPIIGPLAPRSAWAGDDDDDDDDDDSADSGDDDSGGGDEEADDEEEVDEEQPPVTAGGLYVLKTYPQGEIQRPLTMTKGLIELRGGVGFDVGNKTAFETVGAAADIRYGLQDNVELRGGFSGENNFKSFRFYGAFEGSIVYDLVDFRIGATLERSAETTNAAGDTVPAATTFSIPIGFPFRYAPKEQVAVTAFETAFAIQFDSKPDFTPNVGIVIQPQPIVALLLKASLVVADFDFSNTDAVVVPATAAVQLSPNNRLDAGAEFRFNNMKPPEGVNFYDSRNLLFFVRYRL
ncbi:MAG: hypothetical protein IPL61_35415 [Myxococcales bacterium]|nr:hypothetical protein [Myxococcales bacterium]